MIEVKVSAPNAIDLAVLVKSLAAQFGVSLSNAEAEMVVEAEPTLEPQIELPVEEKPKKGKPQGGKSANASTSKESTSAGKEEKIEAPIDTSGAQPPTYTKQDIADACQKVSTKKNLDAAKAILAMFKNDKGEACRRISDVQEADYAAFVKKCEEAVK